MNFEFYSIKDIMSDQWANKLAKSKLKNASVKTGKEEDSPKNANIKSTTKNNNHKLDALR